MIKIAPSILSADFAHMGDAVSRLAGWGADWVHFDVMDGNFVPNITFGPKMCKDVRSLTELPLDVHLMVEHPSDWVKPFADAGANLITIHAEADRHANRTLQQIHEAGLRAGLVLNPGTPVSAAEYLLPFCDLVLLMTVNPGFGGQRFIPNMPEKIAAMRKMIDSTDRPIELEVDGGINPETAKLCMDAGATVLVAGNAVFTAADPANAIFQLRCGKQR